MNFKGLSHLIRLANLYLVKLTEWQKPRILGLEVTFFSHFTETNSSSRNPLGNGSLCSGSLAPVTLNSSCISTLIPAPSLRDGDQQAYQRFCFSREWTFQTIAEEKLPHVQDEHAFPTQGA